jgi:hypothetical protein
LVTLLLAYGLTHAQVVPQEAPFQLALPLQCKLNETCWVYNYVDLDPGPEVLDPGCGHRSYDGHTGTDFGLRDLAAMRGHVPVLASAGGRVKNVRDGMPDISVDVGGKAAIEGKECGNGVLIDHLNGWTTQYCHMMKDSLRVEPGERVEAGQQLGLVGLSGNTEFPHVHLTVRHNDVVIDPFLGKPLNGQCRGVAKPLWQVKTPYQPMSIINWGVANEAPDVRKVRNGEFHETTLSKTSPILIFWVEALGIEPGDTLMMKVTNPQGQTVLNQTTPLQSRKARWFQYMGKRQATPWAAGAYKATVSLSRQPEGLSQSRSLAFTVE